MGWQWGWPKDLIALGAEILHRMLSPVVLPSFTSPLHLVSHFSQKFAEWRKEKKRIFVCAQPKEIKDLQILGDRGVGKTKEEVKETQGRSEKLGQESQRPLAQKYLPLLGLFTTQALLFLSFGEFLCFTLFYDVFPTQTILLVGSDLNMMLWSSKLVVCVHVRAFLSNCPLSKGGWYRFLDLLSLFRVWAPKRL